MNIIADGFIRSMDMSPALAAQHVQHAMFMCMRARAREWASFFDAEFMFKKFIRFFSLLLKQLYDEVEMNVW